MILGISGQVLGRTRSLPATLALFRKLNVRYIELWPSNLEGGIAPEECYEGKDVERAEDTLNEYGIGVACLTLPGAASWATLEGAEAYLTALQGTVDVAKALGASLVNNYCPLARGADTGPLVEVLRAAAAYAALEGVILVLEPMADSASGTVEGMLRILEGVGSEAFKTNFDATNYYQASDEPFPYGYRRLKDYIGYVHLKNGCIHDAAVHGEAGRGGIMPKLGKDRHIHYCPLSEGAVNIEGLLARLREDKYHGFCTIEPHWLPDDLEKCYDAEVSYLRRRGVH